MKHLKHYESRENTQKLRASPTGAFLNTSFQQRLAQNYGQLSPRLREAGDYLVANPLDTATRSLRSVSDESGLAPATFSRLARALSYESFEDLRDALRAQIGRQVASFASRAEGLRKSGENGARGHLDRARDAAVGNIDKLLTQIDADRFEAAVNRLHTTRKVALLGALGSTGIAEYLGYMANFLGPNWTQLGRMGASIGAALADMDERDALIIITKPPYARVSMRAAEMAHAQGVFLMVITDSHACPALRIAQSGFIVPTEGSNFFTSYVATLFLLETLVAMLASKAGPDAAERIGEIERRSRALQEVIDI